MRVLWCGGKKTDKIVNAIEGRFKETGTEFAYVNTVEEFEEYLECGYRFDRAIIIDRALNSDDEIEDEKEIRENINIVSSAINELCRDSQIVFLSATEDIAALIEEESMIISDISKILVKAPEYSVLFFKNLVTTELDDFAEGIVYESKLENKQEDEGDLEWEDDDWETEAEAEEDNIDTENNANDKDTDSEWEDEASDDGVDSDILDSIESGLSSELELVDNEKEIKDTDTDWNTEESEFGTEGSDWNTDDNDWNTDDNDWETDESEWNTQDEDNTSNLEDGQDSQDDEVSSSEDDWEYEETVDNEEESNDELEDYSEDESNTEEGQIHAEEISKQANIYGAEEELSSEDEWEDDTEWEDDSYSENEQGLYGNEGQPVQSYNSSSELYNNNDNTPRNIERIDAGQGVNIKQVKHELDPFASRGTSIVVTGMGGSGTSTVAFNLANVAANLGYTVLLVDFDIENRTQGYMSRNAYDSLSLDGINLVEAVNSSSNIDKATKLVKPGLYILSCGMGGSIAPVEELVRKEKLARFSSMAKNKYNFIIYDIPFKSATTHLAEIVYGADNLVVNIEGNNWGVAKALLSIGNIEYEDMQDAVFNRGQLIFNKVMGINNILGYKAKTIADILDKMDKKTRELAKVDVGIYYRDMEVIGSINFDTEYEQYWFNRTQYSDTPKGSIIYTNLLMKIVLRR